MNEPLHAPRFFGQFGGNRWRCFQRHVRTAEIVKCNPQGNCRFVVTGRLAESIRQSRESSESHAER